MNTHLKKNLNKAILTLFYPLLSVRFLPKSYFKGGCSIFLFDYANISLDKYLNKKKVYNNKFRLKQKFCKKINCKTYQ